MEHSAAIPPGLPRSKPTVSYWQTPPASLAAHRSTAELPLSVDVVIIGSGITGASVAYELLSHAKSVSSSSSVLMLEARTACSGATGRNGGHTKCASYRSFPDNAEKLGEEEAARIVRFEYTCMKAVHAFARENGIECDSWEGDTVDVVYDEGQWRFAKDAVAHLQRVLGEDDPAARFLFWDSCEAEKKFFTKGAVGAVSYEAGSLSAYKFVVGVLALAIEKGLNLQTETPALSVAEGPNGWVVETPRGVIEAKRVVLATNGYTAHLYPQLQGVIVPLRGQITAQRPGSGIGKAGLATTYSFIYADGYDYMIFRPPGSMFEGDIVIGGGLTKGSEAGLNEHGATDDTTIDPAIISYLCKSTEESFGSKWGKDDPQGRIRRQWSGIMGYSADGFPFVDAIPGQTNLFIAASFQGHGMVLCFLAAKALVQIMDGRGGQELDQWFPKTFRVTNERMQHRFHGRLHTTASNDLEIDSLKK